MENNPVNPSVQPTPEPATGVWISKEEYERLRAAESQAPAAAPVGFGSGPQSTQEEIKKDSRRNFWTYVGGGAALLVFLGLSFDLGPLFILPIVGALLVFTILAVNSLKAPAQNLTSAAVGALPQKRKKSALTIVIMVIGILIILPVIPFFLMIVFLIFLASTGQLNGS